jgi:hypothetical protein
VIDASDADWSGTAKQRDRENCSGGGYYECTACAGRCVKECYECNDKRMVEDDYECIDEDDKIDFEDEDDDN